MRGSENAENAQPARAHAVSGKVSLAQAGAANVLKQGAKRTALSDVSNRAPLAASSSGKPASATAKRTSLVRPIRREVSQAVIAVIPEDQDIDTDISEDDAEADMEVDALDVATLHSEESSHAVLAGAPVIEPVYTKQDKLDLKRVTDEFVDEWDEWGDISMVQEYADEIFTYMHELEVSYTRTGPLPETERTLTSRQNKLMPNPNYMHYQNDLEWKMRGILIDWLVQVHARFHLLPETLFLTINYIDRFLSAKTVSLQKLQLVGATALFLASKYEEIQCPSVAEIVYMVDNGYAADEVLKAERFMIGMLDFELGWPGPMSFLRRISKADDYDIDTRTIAKYILETMLMSHLFVACPPSFAAAIADYVSRAILGKEEIWTDAHVYFSTYTESQLKPAVDVLIAECLENGRERHGAIFDKYSDKKHKKVSLFVEAYLNRRTRATNATTTR